MKQFLLLFLVGCGGTSFYVPCGESDASQEVGQEAEQEASTDAGLKINQDDGGIINQDAEAGLMKPCDPDDDDDSKSHEHHHGRHR